MIDGVDPSPRYEEPKTGDIIEITVIEDGFTAFASVWYRGQTIRIAKGSSDYELTLDREGNSWLDLKPTEQEERWGVHYFNTGGWKGKGYDPKDLPDDVDPDTGKPLYTDEMKAALPSAEKPAEKVDRRRGPRARVGSPPTIHTE